MIACVLVSVVGFICVSHTGEPHGQRPMGLISRTFRLYEGSQSAPFVCYPKMPYWLELGCCGGSPPMRGGRNHKPARTGEFLCELLPSSAHMVHRGDRGACARALDDGNRGRARELIVQLLRITRGHWGHLGGHFR